MTSVLALQAEPETIRACTICRDVQNFDLLIEDMETELGEAWGDLSYADARVFLTQPEAADLEFVAVAMDEDDEDNISEIAELIRTAISHSIKVIVIAEEVSPMVLHQLLKLGASEFVPYPLPEGALHDAVARLAKAAEEAPGPETSAAKPTALKPTGDREGVVLPVQGLAGGVGATTFAVNLAWELATSPKTEAPRVCLIDLDLQAGAVSTYLDLPRREAIFELLSDTESMDSESFMQALLSYNDKLHVLTAPAEMLPLDLITPEDIERLLTIARANFDYVVIDMPSTVVQWTESVLSAARVYFSLIELDMRSAQNALRLLRALKAEDLPVEKLRFMLNRGPKFADLTGKARVKRLAETLDIAIDVQLPDGGRQVTQGNDQGTPLAESARKNPLRREIQKIALSAHELNRAVASA
ncbi:AAA family ATPase [Profundibacterium mesophilum]|uniref:Flp pilus assembly protein ATPase CpaE n=1 Tax=Profundibacterium mesophilum KAUST100406-0324 TaxID=1037889 RepID=A0A921NP89_9RHOB|nr:AAA family ATPase [Profundibacterium mesophilum]KAF0675816.1 Flp pilus assembly protein ATPase CpaE [Profundibacterium mesophilum KAUST100406-0324]